MQDGLDETSQELEDKAERLSVIEGVLRGKPGHFLFLTGENVDILP